MFTFCFSPACGVIIVADEETTGLLRRGGQIRFQLPPPLQENKQNYLWMKESKEWKMNRLCSVGKRQNSFCHTLKDSFFSIKAVSFRLELEERHILLVRLSTKGSFLMANSWRKTEIDVVEVRKYGIFIANMLIRVKNTFFCEVKDASKTKFLCRNRQIDLIQGLWKILRSLKGRYLSFVLDARFWHSGVQPFFVCVVIAFAFTILRGWEWCFLSFYTQADHVCIFVFVVIGFAF